MEDMNRKIASAAKWSVFTEVIIKVISPITNIALARLLTPEAFGVVATVIMIISFADIFAEAGFQKYIIQQVFENEDDEDLSICVAFWTNLGISILLWGVLFIFSSEIAILVGNEGLGRVIYIAGILLPMTAFSSIQTAIYKKNLNFKTISHARIMVKIIPFAVTIPLALCGFSYWALIIGNIVGELSNVILLTLMSKWKPKFRYSIVKLKEMFAFCSWALLEAISSWLLTNIGVVIIGGLMGTYYLGLYKVATTTVMQITSIISGASISVLFSALSGLQNDHKRFKQMVFTFQRIIGLLVIPLGVGILIYRDLLVSILLGNQWTEASLLVGLWGFILAESVIFNDISGAVILSKGQPKLLLISNIIQAILIVPAFYISARYGFTTIVIVSSIIRIQLPVTQTIMAKKASGIRIREVLFQLRNYFMATGVMAFAGVIFKNIFKETIAQYLSIVLCIIIYFGILYIIPQSRKELIQYINIAKVKLRKGYEL